MLKTKLGIFIDEQQATTVESLWKRGTHHERLRTTALNLKPKILNQKL